MALNTEKTKKTVYDMWKGSVVPALKEYIKVPNLSPLFDEEWATNGYQEKAMDVIVNWIEAHKVPGLKYEVVKLPGRTPLLFMEMEATAENPDEVGTVLLYGHMDKQPPFEGWKEGYGPCIPIEENGKLYGRGAADDGYAAFGIVTAIKALREQGVKHGRLVALIEGCEESGSPDLPHYVEHLSGRIGSPNLVVCLDSGCGNYEQLWVTTSLRGVMTGKLRVEHIREGVHSGDGSGVVPDTFRLLRLVLDRLEDAETGQVKIPEFSVEPFPEQLMQQTREAAHVLGEEGMVKCFPFLDRCQPVAIKSGDRLTELALNRWWRPQVAYTGIDGLPDVKKAGNVLRPYTTIALSIRLPPTLDPKNASEAMKRVMGASDMPLGTKVTWTETKSAAGWAAPPVAKWLNDAAQNASQTFYNRPAVYQGEGGAIPFMGMLGKKFPKAQFLITGVLGPESNAHGPNEFLHIDYSARLVCCVTSVLSDHCQAKVEASFSQQAKKAKIAPADELTSTYGRRADGTKI
eukprot:Sspe_Gene.40377::Locus_19495_Transcript_2_2_Confidence_0.667_Length_2023::g.40377::m.40377